MLSIARRKAGSTVGCPKCGKPVPVPASAGVAVASDPHAGAKTYNEMPLFERNDFEALLNPAVKAAVKPKVEQDQAIPVPFPDLTSEVSDEAEVVEVEGIVISRGRLTVIAIVVAILLALSFAVGYFLAAATVGKKTAEAT